MKKPVARLWLAVIAGPLAACGSTSGPPAPSVSATPAAAVSVTIARPTDASTIDTQDVVLTGTYSPSTLGENIWALVRPEKAQGLAWPQSENPGAGAPARKDNSQWSVRATLGGPPQHYDIEVYTADSAASSALSSVLMQWARTGVFAGLTATELPPGLTSRARVTVFRGALARITDPSNEGVVTSAGITVRGTYSEGLGDNVWVFVWPEQAPDRGWPQSSNPAAGLPAEKTAGRPEWSVSVFLGGPPQRYGVSVHTADAAASSRLSALLMDWTRTGNSAGLGVGELPTGLNEQQRISITRR